MFTNLEKFIKKELEYADAGDKHFAAPTILCVQQKRNEKHEKEIICLNNALSEGAQEDLKSFFKEAFFNYLDERIICLEVGIYLDIFDGEVWKPCFSYDFYVDGELFYDYEAGLFITSDDIENTDGKNIWYNKIILSLLKYEKYKKENENY
jgi:hypothetical protein